MLLKIRNDTFEVIKPIVNNKFGGDYIGTVLGEYHTQKAYKEFFYYIFEVEDALIGVAIVSYLKGVKDGSNAPGEILHCDGYH